MHDLHEPHYEWLRRRWALPESRIDLVRRLLDAEAEGSTALAVEPAELAGDWGQALASLGTDAAGPAQPRPFVLRQHAGIHYLQSWRYFAAEQTIAGRLLTHTLQAAPPLDRSAASLLAELGTNQVNTQQAHAIACGLAHSVTLITGGPGTGKTYTLARLLALLIVANPKRRPVIRLAAPTGKAADRMKQAIEEASQNLPASLPSGARTALQVAAASTATLHGLLGFNPESGRCRYSEKAQLHCDVLIIDECSMIDTLLWQALLMALAPSTRLVLVGDPHQLESVGIGDVFGSLVRFAQAQPDGPLGRVWVELTESRRFGDRAGIGALATAVRGLLPAQAVQVLENHRMAPDGTAPADGLAWLGVRTARFSWSVLPGPVQAAIAVAADSPIPSEALKALDQVRILAAHRESGMGVAGINQAIGWHLIGRPDVRRAPNEPIIINRNDPETGLRNGSVGIIIETDGKRAAYFPSASPNNGPCAIPLGQLPDHSPAWALTIHRSQGSEFSQVVAVLPRDGSPLATRELIYTAITRASRWLYIAGDPDMVRTALENTENRCTLLEASLESG